jgi:hypothetical protein
VLTVTVAVRVCFGNREAWQIQVMLSNPGKTAEIPTLDGALPA